MHSITTGMKSWKKSDWKIAPYNFPYLAIEPASPLTGLQAQETQELVAMGEFNLRPSEELNENAEDFFEALATELKYHTRGTEGFRPYSEYRREKVRQE